jgi:hypothetical protein
MYVCVCVCVCVCEDVEIVRDYRYYQIILRLYHLYTNNLDDRFSIPRIGKGFFS